MTAISTTTDASTTTTPTPARTIWSAGLVAGVLAAAVNIAVAGIADATEHPLRVDGERIPLLGFPQLTLIGAVLGIALALVLRRRVDRPRAAFVGTTTVLTVLSCLPSVAMGAGDGVGNTVVLVATHVLAAAIIVPLLARRLPATR